MRDQHEGHVAFLLLGEDQIRNLLAGRCVQIARRLVGDEYFGLRRQCAGDRHALLFAARQLAGIMCQSVFQTNRVQLSAGALKGIIHPSQFQRNGDIFQRRHIGDQMEGLKDEPDITAPKACDIIFAHRRNRLAVDGHCARIRTLQTSEHHQQSGLARTGRSDDTHRLTAANIEIDILEHMDRIGCVAEFEINTGKIDQGFCHSNGFLYGGQVIAITGIVLGPKQGNGVLSGKYKQTLRKILFAGFVGLASAIPLSVQALADTVKGVGFGDSLMAGYQLPNGAGFPDRLQAALNEAGYDVTIANAGVSGDTTSGGLARLDWSVPDDTDFVILELGGNDALRGISPDITRDNLDAMISRLKERDIDVLLAGMIAPPNMGEDYGSAFNPIYAELAETHDVPLYPFFLDGAITVEGKMLPDGIHPNETGVDAMVERFIAFMTPYLDEMIAEN